MNHCVVVCRNTVTGEYETVLIRKIGAGSNSSFSMGSVVAAVRLALPQHLEWVATTIPVSEDEILSPSGANV